MPNRAAEDLQKQLLSAIRKGNEVTIERVRAAVSSVRSRAPKLPESKLSVPKLREDAVAYARKLPAPAEVVETAFGFASRVMAEQRKFAAEVKAEARKAVASLRSADSSGDSSGADVPKAGTADADTLTADAPKAADADVDAPKADAPTAEDPKAEAADIGTPQADAAASDGKAGDSTGSEPDAR